MIRVVIDTNVVVSANLVDEGPSAAILSLAIDKKIRMFVSAAVLAEYEEVLHRRRLKFDPKHIEASLADIRDTAELVQPTRNIEEIKRDEPDNPFPGMRRCRRCGIHHHRQHQTFPSSIREHQDRHAATVFRARRGAPCTGRRRLAMEEASLAKIRKCIFTPSTSELTADRATLVFAPL